MTTSRNPEPGQPRLRLFYAVEVPEDIREAIDAAASSLQRLAADARWTPPSGWHLTLAFLGWVDPGRVTDVEAACSAAVEGVEPFRLALDGSAGTFGGKVLWAGIEPSQPLVELAGRLRDELDARDFPVEQRPFRAHLTLARATRTGRLPRNIEAEYRGPRSEWLVERVALMRSRLLRSGARYTIESACRLQGSA